MRPQHEPVFFIDESLAFGDVPRALREAGARVELLVDHFERGAPDESWLAEAGRRGWIVLTKDKRIRRNAVERRALEESGVAAFVLTSGDMTGTEMGSAFVKALDRMIRLHRNHSPPFVGTVDRSGRVRMLTKPPRRAAKRRRR